MTKTFTGALLLAFAASASVHAQTKAAGPVTAAPPAAAAAPAPATMRAGLWEVSIVQPTPNSTAKRTIVSRVCYGAEDVKTPGHIIPQQHESGSSCINSDLKAQGTSLGWKITCKSRDSASIGNGTMTTAADSYAASAKFDTRIAGKPAKYEQTITGKRVGDCK